MRALGLEKKNAGMRILQSQYDRVMEIADDEEKTFSEICREALQDWLDWYESA